MVVAAGRRHINTPVTAARAFRLRRAGADWLRVIVYN